MPRKLAVYIGRFSPFHNGHAETMLRALRTYDRVLVIVGSANQPRTIKNPWSADERVGLIKEWRERLPRENLGELVFATQRDHPYNEQRWLSDIQQHVTNAAFEGGEVWLTGADRDSSTFYLKEFPAYKLDLVREDIEVSKFLTATSIRDIYFGHKLNDRPLTEHEMGLLINQFIPQATIDLLAAFKRTFDYSKLVNEYDFHRQHAAMWHGTPYPVIFQTVDSVVIQTGHVLLIRRRAVPGKGLWALPGGYLNPREWQLDAAIRELREETKIEVPEPVIRGSLKASEVFDDPARSLRGRIVTRAFLFKLPDHIALGDKQVKLPKVKGDDDADKAKWFPLSEIPEMSDKLFEDHHAIIETMMGRL